MITKAYVQSQSQENKNKWKVRIPIVHSIGNDPGCTPDDALPYATVATLKGVSNTVNVGDCVYVSFEDNDASHPVIIGILEGSDYKNTPNTALYSKDPNKVRNTYSEEERSVDLKLRSLEVYNTANLPYNTTIGEFDCSHLKNYFNVIDKLESDIDYIKEHGGGGGGGGSSVTNIIDGAVIGSLLQKVDSSQWINGINSVTYSTSADGQYSFATGGKNHTGFSAKRSFAGGTQTVVLSPYSFAFANNGFVNANNAFLGGGTLNDLQGQNSAIIGGVNNKNYATESLITGTENIATDNSKNTLITGYQNTATANHILIANAYNEVHANYSTAFGHHNNISNNAIASLVGGWYNEIYSAYSFAFGFYLNVNKNGQFVIGSYNEQDNDAMFVVGNGNNNTNVVERSNAFVVKWDGTARLQEQGDTPHSVVIKQYVDQQNTNLQDQIDEIKNNPDIVDIVETFAELEAYDTTILTENDIIRVLRDETKNGASTYYRWVNNEFIYIGKAGDYYTKAETYNKQEINDLIASAVTTAINGNY